MQQEEILEYMKGHDVFMIRTSESQIHHTGLMLHKWWEMPGTTFLGMIIPLSIFH